MKILLAADGSKYTRHAVNYLIKNLRMFGPKPDIHLLTVHVPLPGRAARFVDRATMRDYYEETCRKALAGAKRLLDARHVPYKEVHMIGDPGEAIARYARKGKFSLVIMGSHGHGALTSLVLGSAANKVLASCKVPVLIVR